MDTQSNPLRLFLARASDHRQAIQILLVGELDDMRDMAGDFIAFQHLLPLHQRSTAGVLDVHGEHETRFGQMSDHHLARFDHLDELVLVGIILTVRSVHDERPLAARLELEEIESIGEPGRPPPRGELGRVTERLEDRLRCSGDQSRCTECFHFHLLVV
jgi:hypothetical protein